MKAKNLTLSVFFLSMQMMFAQTPPSDAGTAASQFLNALVEEDVALLRSLMGSDFVLVSFDGERVDANTLLEGVNGGYVEIETGTNSSSYVRHYQDTRVVTGIWAVKGSIQGQSFNNRLAYTLVIVRQGGFWKVVSVQFTPS